MSIVEEIQGRMNAAINKLQRDFDLFYFFGIEPKPEKPSKGKFTTYADVVKK